MEYKTLEKSYYASLQGEEIEHIYKSDKGHHLTKYNRLLLKKTNL